MITNQKITLTPPLTYPLCHFINATAKLAQQTTQQTLNFYAAKSRKS